MFFSKNTARLIQKTIKNILGVPITCHYEKYLGLPPIVCRSKYAAFAEIKKQVWKEKMLAQNGFEILIEAIA